MSIFEDFKKDVLAILTKKAPTSSATLPVKPIEQRVIKPDLSKVPADQEKFPSGAVITSPMGKRIHPVKGTESEHMGVDISGIGNSPVYAVADALVTAAYFGKGGGNTISISYKIGEDVIIVTYMHLSKMDVKKGDIVKAGQKIGNIGKTGNLVTGTHLHLEYSVNGIKKPAPLYIMQAAIKYKIKDK